MRRHPLETSVVVSLATSGAFPPNAYEGEMESKCDCVEVQDALLVL
jgi:hypothetical protein